MKGFVILLLLLLLFPTVLSKTCSNEWGNCNSNIDDSYNCNGIQSDFEHVIDIYINSTSPILGDYVNVMCEFYETGNTSYEYLFYFNGSTWKKIREWTSNNIGIFNRSADVLLNGIGKNIFRCTISRTQILDFCADTESTFKDNDDVSINVSTLFQDVKMVYKEKESTIFNLFQDVKVEVISQADTINLKLVKPSGEISTSMEEVNGMYYTILNGSFSLEEKGNYTLYLTAIKNNIEEVFEKTFEVVDILQVIIENKKEIYNNGDTISVKIFDINNIPFTTNVTAYIGNKKVFDGYTSEFDYTIENNIDGTYVFRVNAEKDQNHGYIEETIKITDDLYIDVIYPNKTTFNVNKNIPVIFKVRNVRGEYIKGGISGSVDCNGLVSDIKFISILNPFPYEYYRDVYYTYYCFSPPEYGKNFIIQIDISDIYSNTAKKVITLSTIQKQENTTKTSIRDIEEKNNVEDKDTIMSCYCTEWKNEGCWLYRCENDEMYQTRFCYPRGCDIEERCYRSFECVGKKEIDLEVEDRVYEIIQGESISIPINIHNKGNVTLYINVNVSSTCCYVSVTPKITLFPFSSITINMILKTKLKEKIGENEINISIGFKNLVKKKKLRFIVKMNPFLKKFNDIIKKFNTIEREVSLYNNMGMNVKKIKDIMEEIRIVIDYANVSIKNNEIFGLKSNVIYAKSLLEEADKEIFFLRLQKNILSLKELLVLLLIIILLIIYYVKKIVIPIININKEIKSYESIEHEIMEKRIETEKQYFMRKIDEETFNRIMIQDQNELYNIRGKIRELKEKKRIIIYSSTIILILLNRIIQKIKRKK